MARTARPNLLTELQVRAYATGTPTGKELHDGAGLYLRRRDAGAYWYLRCASPVTGRPQWLKLFDGDALDGYPHKTLKDAREEAERKRALLRDGLDPRIERRKAVERERAAEKARTADIAAARTVEDLFAEFRRTELRPVVKDGVRERGRKDGGAGAEAHMRLHVFPRIGRMPARDVTKADLLAALDAMRAKEIHRSANVALQVLKQFFAWAGPGRREYLPSDPAAGLDKRAAGGRDAVRKRHLCATRNPPKREEIGELAKRLPRSGLSEPMQACVWIMLSTLVRVGELASARWEHVNLRARTWHLPDTKSQVPHLVYLSAFSASQFRVLRRVHDERVKRELIPEGCPWVLPGRDGKDHIDPLAITKQLTDRQAEGEPLANRTKVSQSLVLPHGRWTAHDLRRTGATLMRQLGAPSEVVHLCLNHRDKKLLSEIYLQDDDATAQRKAFVLLGLRLSELAAGSRGVIRFDADGDDHRRAALAQREAILRAADDVEAGRPPRDPRWIAAVLRRAAEAVPLEPPRGRGAPRRFDRTGATLAYGWLRAHDGMAHAEAVLELAVRLDVSPQAINAALPPAVRREALRLFQGARLVRPRRRR